MTQTHRLSDRGRIDRTKPIAFRFNGAIIHGYAGDTIASALIANGLHLMGRSFKYHRPRGLLSHGSEEPNALLDIDRGFGRADPNNRASVAEAREGLVVASQNHWPSLRYDFGAINDRLSPIFVAGFYYKTFMWPASFWKKLYEPIIRRAAGLGTAPAIADPDHYQHRHAHCDVLVAGAGPAGVSAALAASADGARVMLVDEQSEPGGTLLHERDAMIGGLAAQAWLSQALGTLRSRKNVTLLARTTAFGYYNHNHLALAERLTDHLVNPHPDLPRERLWQVRAGRVVLATGALERPLLFADNDRPGIMLAESVRALLNRYGAIAGRRVVIATSGASPYGLVRDLRSIGVVVTVVDSRPEEDCGPEVFAARESGCEVLTGHGIAGSTGRLRVTGLKVTPLDSSGGVRLLPCDCVAMHGGWTPNVHLFSQSRGKMRFDAGLDAFVPGLPVQAEMSVGAARGIYDLAACIADGRTAAGPAADRAAAIMPSAAGGQTATVATQAFLKTGKAFVDFQNDVTAKDIRLAVREGFESIEHVKRYTTTGMATDQGKTSNMNALALVAGALGKPVPQVGTTTFRLPYTPVSFNALAGPNRGKLFDPARHTPLHGWAQAHGAVFEDVGLWKRAWYFPKGSEDLHACVARECLAVRTSVGIFDASTLGKIEVVGPDAAAFLNLVYVNAFAKLETGRSRYGLMLKEDGYIMDDGVIARLGPDRFHVTTTTGGAARVLAHMEDYLQTEWPHLRVALTSVTEQWAVIAIQGPRARDVLAGLAGDIDLSNAACPHMSVRSGSICGVPCRLFRMSFTGELGYEINVPADYAAHVWEALMQAGQPFGITPYGTEAMHVLRAEKGYIIVGQETDGTVTPQDVGLGGLVSKLKPDFVGKRSLARPDVVAAGRKQLVGLLTLDPQALLDEGAQIVADPAQSIPVTMLGHVTSSYQSACCGHSIALAMLSGGERWQGQEMFVTIPGGFAKVRVCAPVFVDPRGERIHG